MPLHDRIFRALLRLFPREFRGDFGDQMVDDFRDQREEAARSGSVGLLRLWQRTGLDILHRAPREHLDMLRRDAAYAIRIFRRRPGMTLSALATLGIGIGLNAAVFSVVHSILWRSLPLPESDRIVYLSEVGPPPERELMRASPANFLDWQSQSRSLDALTTVSVRSATVVRGNMAERIIGAAVTPDFFQIVSARTAAGRLLTRDDYLPLAAWLQTQDDEHPQGAAPPGVVVISYALWQRQFGGRTDVIGQTMQVDRRETVEIVGVLEKDFVFPLVSNAEYWIPTVLDSAQRRARYVLAIGRLAPGASVAAAQAEFDVIGRQLASAYPDANEGHGVRVMSLRDHVTAGVRKQLWFLGGAALCVLLIACANVSNLLLTHSSGRQRELQTRVALGATRAHLVRQALTEGMLLAGAGGIAGLLLARWAVPSLVATAPAQIPRLDEVTVGPPVLVFAAVISLVIGSVCGLVAISGSARASLHAPLRTIGASATSQGASVRQVLAVSQVALALVLAVAASLLVQTMRAVMALPLGFSPENVISIGFAPDVVGLRGTGQKARLEADIIEAIRGVPGVVAAGIGSRPLTRGGLGTRFELRGARPRQIDIGVDAVGTGYLDALGALLLAGRFFTERDGPEAPDVALVNETAARRYFPNGAVGQTLWSNGREITIVGVLGDVRRTGLEDVPEPTLYRPSAQTSNLWTNNLLVRTEGDPGELLPAIRTVVAQVRPDLPLTNFRTLEDQLREVTAPRRFTLWVVGLFSAVALGLALVGIYAVVAESVMQRVPEIGVRMALGATPGAVMLMILRQGGWLIAGGVAIGMAAALALNGVMTTFVFGVPTTDPASYTIAAAGLAGAGFAACAIPARRAARVDPAIALRYD